MKRKMKWIVFFVALMVAAGGVAADSMSVQIRDGIVRNKASFLGASVAPVAYGDRVEVLASQGDWRQVQLASGAVGWIHSSALTPKRVVLTAADHNDVRLAAAGEEVALAGKGFSEEVEKEYKKQNRALDYSWVDRMEKWKISDDQAARFLREGGLAR